ncbi:hypothetical protein [Streptococcus porcinus]|uniref:Lipoprotein n=1 Tax=Streptococcus porcinus TaxID=1340 RepID=A0A7W0ARW9_STRPO|nr:hypothetical protein [Streptococcus porcinus]MBA2795516.1 hypothetical protein [Streptococcus porcinus]
MKKKLLGLIVLALSAIFLVACGNSSIVSKDNLDGDYYFISYTDKLSNNVALKIKGNNLTKFDMGGKYVYSIDKEKKTLTGDGKVYSYSYEDGKLITDISDNSTEYYQKGSKAYKEIKAKE